MYNYFLELIWKMDVALALFSLALLLLIPCYGIFRSYSANRRLKKLLKIKEKVYCITLGEAKAGLCEEMPLSENISAQTFLDVASNRIREGVFFNEAEQAIFKKRYISPENIGKLISTAGRSLHKWRRIEAILALGYAGVDASIEVLKEGLRDKDEDVSYFSALALGQIKNMDSASLLLEFLKNNPVHRYKIASLLGQFPAQISSEVIKLTREKDPSLRFWALRIITSINDPVYRDQIEKLTRDESAEVKGAACECLGVIGDKNSAKIIKECLGDESWFARAQGVLALEKILGSASVEDVIDLVKDNSWLVLDSVKKVLVKHIESAFPYLERLLAQDDILAKKIAVEVIELSGYMPKLYSKLLAGGPEGEKTLVLLKNMISAGAYKGMK